MADVTSPETAIKVTNVSKTFKLPHEKVSSLKNIFAHLISYVRKRRSFEKQQALKDISFEVKVGEFFGIVGRNGSGKSTLLKLLAGIYKQDTGTIEVNGKLTPFIELGVGFNMELTGRDNVFLNGALLGFSRKEMDAMYQDIVDFAELERFMDQKLRNYSSGMQVRLAFSIAIRARGDILLLDEVLAVGDAAFQQKCYNYFEELKEQNRTVVFVSHDMGAVRRFCTEAVFIKNGKLIYKGKPSDVADVYMTENIEDGPKAAKGSSSVPVPQTQHKILAKIVEQSRGQVLLEVNYESKDKQEMYVGISIAKDGVSIGEITTSLEKPLIGNGKITYALDTSIFNSGIYHIGCGLFKLKNRELVSAGQKKCEFIIKGSDVTRGAAVKLTDTWEY